MTGRVIQFIVVLGYITSGQMVLADQGIEQDQVKKKSPIVKPQSVEPQKRPTVNKNEKNITGDDKKTSTSPPEKRDPFETTDEIRTRASKAIPQIRVLGIATDHVSKPVAIIDVQGAGVFFVRPGDKISLRLTSGNSTLIVTEITTNNAVLKIGSVGDELIIR